MDSNIQLTSHKMATESKRMRKFKCELCEYETSLLANLKTHVRMVHSKIKSFKCNFCEYAATLASTVKQHIKAVHEKIKDETCEVCGKSFSYIAHLRTHVLSVHGVKKFKCKICPFATSNSVNLNRHIDRIPGLRFVLFMSCFPCKYFEIS